jgi:UDP-2-acetamido-2-deoxy-ribo-hexuluronate aminotransferase
MEFRDLKKQYQVLRGEMEATLLKAAESGAYIMGPPVRELEKRLASYVGVKHCISCANGTDAMTLALMAWGIGPGDAVFVPDFTFFASAEVVSYAGATPIFVDVDEDTFNICPEKLEESVASVAQEGRLVPRAVIAVDLFGLPANHIAIRSVADRFGLWVLEDGAQGFGGSIGERKTCSFGDISTTSFFPAKPLGCYGDGGAVFTNSDEWAALINSLRFHGKGSDKYDNVRIGLNSRLDTLQAAVLHVKFDAFLAHELADVDRIANAYTKRLKGIVKTPIVPHGYTSSWAQYTITLKDEAQRNALQQSLRQQGIPSMVYYPRPMHMQTAFEGLGYRKGDFAVTERLCACVLSLPMHPYLLDDEIERVCNGIIGYIS